MDKLGPKKRIGILGGSFNPVHFGHLAIAVAAKEQVDLDLVLFIPARIPPHKNSQNLIDPKLRYEMTQLAIADNEDFNISNIEIAKETVSYSVETLNSIKETYPQGELFFIIGSDSVGELKTWRMIDEIFKLCRFIVARRPDFENFEEFALPSSAIILDGLYPDISSTHIRDCLKQGLSVERLVPDLVIRFIKENKLYT